MKKLGGTFLGMMMMLFSLSQDTIPAASLDEILIYSGKFAEKKKNIVQRIEVINASRIRNMNAQNTGDLLMNTGNVFVQKSQQGGSSPVIRGFEASRVLLVIDGIRMNNAIYRSGHLQNVITVDQNMLERIEVLYGPSSTIYGSDALGGVVHMRTKMPALSSDEKKVFRGSFFTRYSSANQEKTFHADMSLGGKKMGWLQSFNYSDFSDLKMGSKDHKDYPGFGRRNEYITTINGVDSIVQNPDNRIQKFSGYSQWDLTQKLYYAPSEKTGHLLNFQFSNSGNIPRYDRLQDRSNGILRFAEWYYGPQQRTLAAYEFNRKELGWFTEFRTILSYQNIRESRHQRNYRSPRLENREEKVDVAAITIDGRKLWNFHELTIGADAQFNHVNSSAFLFNKQNGETSQLDTRYPDGSNRMLLAGVYAQHLVKSRNGKWVLNDGLRLQTSTLRSEISDNSFFNFPFTTIDQKNMALTANLGMVFMPSAKWRLNAGISSGFRTPNIDDLGKIFESNSASRQLIIPNAGIRPEYTYNADLGMSFTKEKFRFETGGFYTRFVNAIALAPFSLNGEDSIDYNGIRSAVFASQNVNRASLYGFHAALQIQFTTSLSLTSNLNYTYGRLLPERTGKIPLDHIPPLFGRTAINFSVPSGHVEIYALYNGWKKLKDYHPSGEDNAQYATADGTPSWMTLNIKGGIPYKKWLVQAGIENLLDRNYRLFASGFSAPGRNLSLALRYNF